MKKYFIFIFIINIYFCNHLFAEDHTKTYISETNKNLNPHFRTGANNSKTTIINSYVDFNIDKTNIKTGVLPVILHKGFLINDNVSGAAITFNDKNIKIPLYWIKESEGGIGKNTNNYDIDWLIVSPQFNLSNTL